MLVSCSVVRLSSIAVLYLSVTFVGVISLLPSKKRMWGTYQREKNWVPATQIFERSNICLCRVIVNEMINVYCVVGGISFVTPVVFRDDR